MKFGAHVFLWIDRFSDQALFVFDRAKALGLSILEVAVGDDVLFTPRTVRRHAERVGIELTFSPGSQWPMEADVSADSLEQRSFGLTWHKHWIDMAAEVGAVSYCGGLYGHPGKILRRFPPPDEFPRAAEGLDILGEYAAKRGMKLVIEPMSHFRTHLVNTPAQAMRLLELAENPNVYILLDTYHLLTEIRDYAAAARLTRSKLWGLHACENDRGVPGGGLVPWKALFSALQPIEDDFHILLESYNSSLNEFAFRRGLFHDVCPDGDAFVKAGLAFLRESLENAARRASTTRV